MDRGTRERRTSRRRSFVAWPLVPVLLLLLTASSELGAPAAMASAPSGFITRSGTQLMLDGQPYTFTGVNIYNINSDGWCGPEMRSGQKLDQALTAIGPGKDVIRGWFFQSSAIDWATNTRDWSAFDHALNVADAHGMKVIPTLTDEWGECGTHVSDPANGTKTKQWYVDGYKDTQPGMLASYRDWVAEVVDRYKDDPRIAFWQLINEAEIRYVDGGGNDLPCPVGDEPADILKAWASDVSGVVKAIDPNHLVSLGTIGSGQCGAQGPQYLSVHDVSTIDLCEFHDYGSPLVGIPGDVYNGMQLRIDQCDALDKPLFVGEAGIIPNDVGGFQARADAFRAKIDAQFGAGVRGFLAWAWSPASTPSTLDSYDLGPGDPSFASLINWEFEGFSPPVDNPDVLNVVKAGQTVPLKWRLVHPGGAPVTTLSSVSVHVTSLACSDGSTSDALEETASGSSGLQNLGDGYYQFNWKTPKSYARSCKTVHLDLGEGTTRDALFRFSK